MTGRAKKYFHTLLGHRIVFPTPISSLENVRFINMPLFGESEFSIRKKELQYEMLKAMEISSHDLMYGARPGGVYQIANARDSIKHSYFSVFGPVTFEISNRIGNHMIGLSDGTHYSLLRSLRIKDLDRVAETIYRTNLLSTVKVSYQTMLELKDISAGMGAAFSH